MKQEKAFNAKINAKGMQITVVSDGSYDDYISLTDIAKYKSEDPAASIQNWMRSRDVIEFLGLWETLYNPDFKPLEFEGFKLRAGSNAFTLSPKRWVEATAAIGMYYVKQIQSWKEIFEIMLRFSSLLSYLILRV